MKRRKLTKREFARAIKNGLGSAFLHIREHGDKGVEKELLHACLTNMVYDRQIDSGRSYWLARMLDHTGRIKEYADEIRKALIQAPKEGADFVQLIDLATELFERGFGEFKSVLLALPPVEDNRDEPLKLGEALVDVASLAGFEAAARMMMSTPTDMWEKQSLFEYACETFESKKTVTSWLEENAKRDPSLAQFWKEVQEKLALSAEPVNREPRLPWTLSQVLASIETEPKPRIHSGEYRRFGRTAKDNEILCVLDRLTGENNPSRLYSYLTVFWDKALPVVPENVLELLLCDDKDLRRSARNALSNVKSAEVRDLGVTALQSELDDQIVSGINLLKLNYIPNDLELLAAGLRRLKDIDRIHWGATAAIDIAENANDAGLTEVLIWLHDHGPCGNCRKRILKQLFRSGTAPSQLLYEAQWDVEEHVRLIARGFIDNPASKHDGRG